MNYPNKREIIQEILDENGCLNWCAQPAKQNPAIPRIIFFLSQDSKIKIETEAGTESNFRVLFLSGFYHRSVRRIVSVSDDYRGSIRRTRSVQPSAA
jgi:hypothetical protein